MGSHALLQGIFPTQGSNPGLLLCRPSLPSAFYHLSHQGSPQRRYNTTVLITHTPQLVLPPPPWFYSALFSSLSGESSTLRKGRQVRIPQHPSYPCLFACFLSLSLSLCPFLPSFLPSSLPHSSYKTNRSPRFSLREHLSFLQMNFHLTDWSPESFCSRTSL